MKRPTKNREDHRDWSKIGMERKRVIEMDGKLVESKKVEREKKCGEREYSRAENKREVVV